MIKKFIRLKRKGIFFYFIFTMATQHVSIKNKISRMCQLFPNVSITSFFSFSINAKYVEIKKKKKKCRRNTEIDSPRDYHSIEHFRLLQSNIILLATIKRYQPGIFSAWKLKHWLTPLHACRHRYASLVYTPTMLITC